MVESPITQTNKLSTMYPNVIWRCQARLQGQCGVQLWPKYLIEFRAVYPTLRINEFIDSVQHVLSADDLQHMNKEVVLEACIPDTTALNAPAICAYTRLPNAAVAAAVAKRCSMLRSITEVWGDGTDADDVSNQATATLIALVDKGECPQGDWRVVFRRFGIAGNSGMDSAGKRQLLLGYTPLLRQLPGAVNLANAQVDLLHLEDWHSYHQERQALAHQLGTDDAAALNTAKQFCGHRTIFGRVVGQGADVQLAFDLVRRPYVGTTSMKAVPAHAAAVAAMVSPGDLVLDPFCGTGGLLLACAHLGADVVGSDIEEVETDPSSSSEEEAASRPAEQQGGGKQSRYARFRRRDGSTQAGVSAADNFRFYGLQDRLRGLLQCPVSQWMRQPTGSPDVSARIAQYAEFDAIVTDPPYGRRERPSTGVLASGASVAATGAADGQSSPAADGLYHECEGFVAVMVQLFQVAAHRLRCGGRLVFWLPTDLGTTDHGVVSARVEAILRLAAGSDGGGEGGSEPVAALRLLRVAPEEMGSLCRWQCVLVRE